jgi:hypothetical protein
MRLAAALSCAFVLLACSSSSAPNVGVTLLDAGSTSSRDASVNHDASTSRDATTADASMSPIDASTMALDATSDASTSLPLQGNAITVSAFTTQAIQTAIASANSGDTVVFPAGTYAITTTITLKSGVLYHGDPGAILHSTTGNVIAATDATCANISIDGLTFDAGILKVDGSNSSQKYGTSIVVVNSTFQNISTIYMSNWVTINAIFLSQISDSRFEYNTFKNITYSDQTNDANGIIGYNLANVSIAWSTFTNVFQGMHLEPKNANAPSGQAGVGSGLSVVHNKMTGVTRMGVEVQTIANGMVIDSNQLTDWTVTGAPASCGYGNGMGLSIVPSSGTGTQITNNVIHGNVANGSLCNTNGIELNVVQGVVSGNDVQYWETGISVSCATGTNVLGNTFANIGKYGTFSKDGGYCTGLVIDTNDINGQDVDGGTVN